MKGCIFDIQRCCMEDGPGIRTTVFLKGCNLRCRWCHNPESFEKKPQLTYDSSRCTVCRKCESVCLHKAHIFQKQIHLIDFKKCTLCQACLNVCRTKAVSQVGWWAESGEVADIIVRDKKYYDKSGGGVTFSGGEPTMQPEFLLDLLKSCKERGISTAIETNGMVDESMFWDILAETDLFLLDYKCTDPYESMKYTGRENNNVYRLLDMLTAAEKDVVLRCPIIPEVNYYDKHIEAIRDIVIQYPCIRKAEIMPYHSAGKGKWGKIGLSYELDEIRSMDLNETKELENIINEPAPQ